MFVKLAIVAAVLLVSWNLIGKYLGSAHASAGVVGGYNITFAMIGIAALAFVVWRRVK